MFMDDMQRLMVYPLINITINDKRIREASQLKNNDRVHLVDTEWPLVYNIMIIDKEKLELQALAKSFI